MKPNYDAIIIGAGIIGCCIAYELTKRGRRTLNIDFQPNAGAGSTCNSCGNVRFHYSTFDGVAIAYEGAWYWHHWRQYIGDEDPRGLAKFHDTGSIFIMSELVDWPKIMANYDKVGVKYEQWDLPTLEKRIPNCDYHSFYPPKRPEDPQFDAKSDMAVNGAIYTPESGYISDPMLAAQNVEHAARAGGAAFRYNARVTGIRRDEQRVCGVTLSNGDRIDAPVVVNVGGPHSFQLTEMAGQTTANRITTRALRHEVHVVPHPQSTTPQEPCYLTNDTDIGAYYRPEVGGKLLIGSVDPECDPKQWVDPDNFDRRVTANQWKAQVYRVALRIPNLPIPLRPAGVVDLYDVSDDWIPVYDKSDLNGYYQAIGTSGNQFKTAPVAGAMMAELIERVEAGYDHDAAPLQYKLSHTGNMVDTGIFHRRRQVNPNSTFSVLG